MKREARGERREEAGVAARSRRERFNWALSPLPSRLSPLCVIAALAAITLTGCGSVVRRGAESPPARAADGAAPTQPRGGGYYLNDGPGDHPPANLDQVPDPVPKLEPLHRGAMRPYSVMGYSYTPMTQLVPYKARGLATWYGRRYHGSKTSSGEIYDMYGMSAAHTILPIPSYARVTNPRNNKSVIVRINDRGPFFPDRLIDLSYAAAYKLGIVATGSGIVEVEAIIPDAGIATPAVAATSPTVAAPVALPAALATAATAPVPTPIDGVSHEAPGAAPDATTQAIPEPVATAPVVPMTSDQQGVFLQLGAFGSEDNAENYLARLQVQMDWLGSLLHVYPKDGLFRVHAGPYANQAEARAAADRISRVLGIKAVVLVR